MEAVEEETELRPLEGPDHMMVQGQKRVEKCWPHPCWVEERNARNSADAMGEIQLKKSVVVERSQEAPLVESSGLLEVHQASLTEELFHRGRAL